MMDTDHILEEIRRVLDDPGIGALAPGREERAWGEPLVGVARGDDPLFVEFRDSIGPFYWTPPDVHRIAFPGSTAGASELAVIVYVLPQTEATRADQRACDTLPAHRWSLSRYYGEEINNRIRRDLSRALTDAGYPAVAPVELSSWSREESETFGMASRWSERHAAYAAGLGTFGHTDALITARGMAVRIGSVVARIDLPATPRPYTTRDQYCLGREGCKGCINRCPAGAITPEGHDKERCSAYIEEVTAPHAEEAVGVRAPACGLCQTRVPCESGIPRD